MTLELTDECSAVRVGDTVVHIGVDIAPEGSRSAYWQTMVRPHDSSPCGTAHGIGNRGSRRTLSMGVVKHANDDEKFYRQLDFHRMKCSQEAWGRAMDRQIMRAFTESFDSSGEER